MRRLPRLRIVIVRQISQKRSLVDVVDDGGLKVVVAGQLVSTNSGPLRRGVALAICLVRPQPPREELVTLRLHCCWTPDMKVGVRDFERELPVRVTTDLVSKDQPKADSFEPRDICGFVLDIRDGQIDVEDWLGDESVNRGRSDVADAKHLVGDGCFDELPNTAVLGVPAILMFMERPWSNLPVSDPLRLAIGVRQREERPPQRVGCHGAILS